MAVTNNEPYKNDTDYDQSKHIWMAETEIVPVTRWCKLPFVENMQGVQQKYYAANGKIRFENISENRGWLYPVGRKHERNTAQKKTVIPMTAIVGNQKQY